MVTIDYDTAHSIVDNNKNLSWNGWKIIDFKKDFKAEFSQNGIRMNGVWGFYKVYDVDSNGWRVPKKYVGR